MTVSSSTGRTWTVNQIISRAYKRARLLNISQTPTEEQYIFGRESLEDILDKLPGEAPICRVKDFVAQTLTASTFQYTLPSTVLDILDPAMYYDATVTDVTKGSGGTVIRVVSEEEYQRLSAKDAEGRPVYVFPYRVNDILQAWFWPIPDEAGTVRFLVHRHLADVDDGNATVDLEGYWIQYLKVALAYELADSSSMPEAQLGRLAQEAQIELGKAKGRSRSGAPVYIHMDHGAPAGGRW